MCLVWFDSAFRCVQRMLDDLLDLLFLLPLSPSPKSHRMKQKKNSTQARMRMRRDMRERWNKHLGTLGVDLVTCGKWEYFCEFLRRSCGDPNPHRWEKKILGFVRIQSCIYMALEILQTYNKASSGWMCACALYRPLSVRHASSMGHI